MTKYFIKNFFRGIMINLIIMFPVSIIFVMFIGLGASAKDWMVSYLAVIISAAVSVVVLFVVMIFVFRSEIFKEFFLGISDTWISKYDLERFRSGEKQNIIGNKVLVENAVSNNCVSFFTALLWLSLHLLISVGCIVIAVLIKDYCISDPDKWLFVPGAASATATIQLMYFLVRLVYYVKFTCPKCKKIFSRVEDETLSYDSHISEWEKDKTYKEEVGKVYYKDTKIGSVYQDRTVTDKYVGCYSEKKLRCRCFNCGKYSEVKKIYVDAYKK